MNPQDIPTVDRLLRREFEKNRAPVIEFVQEQTQDPFKVLVATILSARTRDETTTQVIRTLFAEVESLEDLSRTPLKTVEKLIFPVGFYRVKARHLKALPGILEKEFNGRIPDSVDALCKLPGVGRKTANLVVSVAFDKPGICVDVHVHRICNRWGLLKTATPLETEMTLREILPRRYWKAWNRQLVSFGQTRCGPRNPNCRDCPVRRYCEQVGVDLNRHTKGN